MVSADELVAGEALSPAPGVEPSTAQTHQPAASEGPPGASLAVPRQRLTDVALDAIAMLAAELVPAESISQGTGVELHKVRKLLRGHDERFNAILDGYRERRLRATGGHLFRLYQFHEAAYRAIEDGLASGDIKVRVDTAWKVFDRTVPAPKAKDPATPVDVTLNLPPAALEQLARASVEVQAFLSARTPGGPTPEERLLKHVKVGEAALPRPPAQLQVELGEASDPANAPPDDPFVELPEPPE